MDKIIIKDLEIFANHGVFPEENTLGQKFLVSAVLFTDIKKAGKTDELEYSINYGEISHYIKEFMEKNTYKLIEAVVENLAFNMLTDFKSLKKVKLELKKPWAPIGLSLNTASVCIERGWHKTYIAIGSNMGDSKEYLDNAVAELKQTKGCRVKKVSGYIVTKPYGVTEQDDFLNGCIEMDTLLYPQELLKKLHKIEKAANRERKIHWGPRTLDLDIIFYDKLVMESDDLIIPHIDMENRDFVLKPMTEIAPNMRHPILQKTMTQLLSQLNK